MNRQELKQLWFSLDYSNVKERKQIIVEIDKNPYWPGYGDVEILREGPDGYSSFKTHQEHPLQYALEMMEGDNHNDYSKYELIIKE